MYVRWDWDTTLARLRPLLSITGVLGDPVLPELCLLVRTRPGQDREEEKRRRRTGSNTQTDSVCLPPNPGQEESGNTRGGSTPASN